MALGRAVARVALPPNATIEPPPFGVVLDFERLPDAAAWSRWSPTAIGDSLSQRVRRAFDPAGVLNPGILGDCHSGGGAT